MCRRWKCWLLIQRKRFRLDIISHVSNSLGRWVIMILIFFFFYNLGYLLPSIGDFGPKPEGHSILDSREQIPQGTCKPSCPQAPGKIMRGGQRR